MDFSDLGGTQIDPTPTSQPIGKGVDFSDLGGVPVAPPEEKSISGFLKNAASDVGDIASGVGGLAKGLVTHPLDTIGDVAKNIIPSTIGEYKEAISHPIEHTYQHPVNTLMDVAPFIAPALNVGEEAGLTAKAGELGAEEAGQAGRIGSEGANLSKVGELSAPTEKAATTTPNAGKVPIDLQLNMPQKPVAPDFVPSAERLRAQETIRALGGNVRQWGHVLGDDPVKSAGEIRDWLDTAKDGKSLIEYGDRPGELLEKTTSLDKSYGKTIGNIIDQLNKAAPEGISKPAILLDVKNELTELAHMTANPETEGRMLKLTKVADHLGEKDMSAFDVLQKLKESAGEQLDRDPEMGKAYGLLADRMNQSVAIYGKLIGNPDIKAAYDEAKHGYTMTSKIIPILQRQEVKDLMGTRGGISLHGLIGTVGSAISGLPTPEQFGRNIMLKTPNWIPKTIGAIRGIVPSSSQVGTVAQLELANALTNKYKNQGNRNQ